ncbi:MAG: hypothetical protein AAFQ79_04955 [Pseudomonadota bacterium]
MARSIFYREKSPQGPWQRASGTLPLTVTGLTNDIVYEVDTGDGTLTEITPSSAFAETPVTADGSAYLQSAITIPDTDAFLWFGSYIPGVNGRLALLSTAGVTGSMHSWDDAAGPRFRSYVRSDGAALIHTSPSVPVGTRIHALVRGYGSGGDMIVDVALWDSVSGAWSLLGPEARNGSVFEFSTGMSGPYRLFERSDSGGQGFNGTVFRTAMWTGVSPDITQSAVRDVFTNGGIAIDPALAVAAYGTPIFDLYGPAARFNTPTHGGSDSSLTTQGSFSDG